MADSRISCVWVVILLVSSLAGYAQRQLVLVKGNHIVARYSEGERIRFQRKGQDFFTTDVITGIYRGYFKMGEMDTAWLHQVKSIDLRAHPNSNFKTAQAGVKLIVAGVVLFLIDAFDAGDSLDPGVVAVSSGLIGTGVLLQFVNNNYFKTGYRKKVIVMGEAP